MNEKPFLLTTAAQNIHVLFRKSPLCRSHFFEWLKTAISSTACGTSTLKSPLLRAFFTPYVHSRLRKRLSRCTLDCGFKTSESPALRGFVAERCPITGTSLYLVLKSNGPHRSKNLPVKFGFSSKTVPANIAKKLPPQRCSKPFLITFFNFSHKWPAFAFTVESEYTLGSLRKTAHRGLHAETGGVLDGGAVTNPRSVPHGIVIRKLSFATPGLCRLIFDYCGAISALPGAFSLVTAVRFLNGQKPFLLTTAAQNMYDLH